MPNAIDAATANHGLISLSNGANWKWLTKMNNEALATMPMGRASLRGTGTRGTQTSTMSPVKRTSSRDRSPKKPNVASVQ